MWKETQCATEWAMARYPGKELTMIPHRRNGFSYVIHHRNSVSMGSELAGLYQYTEKLHSTRLLNTTHQIKWKHQVSSQKVQSIPNKSNSLSTSNWSSRHQFTRRGLSFLAFTSKTEKFKKDWQPQTAGITHQRRHLNEQYETTDDRLGIKVQVLSAFGS